MTSAMRSHPSETHVKDASLISGQLSDEVLFSEIFELRKNYPCNFIFAHVNINSFRHKFSALQDILAKNCLDYLAVSESKLDASFPIAQFGVEGFTMYRQDNTDRSGGILVYIRSDLPHRRLLDVEHNDDGIESLCLEITVGKNKTVISCIYKHPKMKLELFKNKMCFIADNVFTKCSDTIFLGDMNCCPLLSNTVKDICDLYDLRNLIHEPTCHKGNTSTLIDVVLVSNPRKYVKSLNCPCELSDFHNFVGAVTRRFAPSQRPRHINYRTYKNFNEADFCCDISTAPFQVSDIFDDVEDMAWYTSQLLADIVNTHAPMKSKQVKCDSVPYMNSRLRKAIYARNMSRNKFRKFGHKFWEENRRMRNKVVSIRKQSLKTYFSKNCSKQDKSFWRTVSPFMSDKSSRNGNNIILQEDDQTIVDDKQISEIFNDFFSNIASTIGFDDSITSTTDSILKHKNHPSVVKINGKFADRANTFVFNEINPEIIQRKLKALNIRKATGYDGIPGKLLRLAHRELSVPIASLINTCISNNKFPGIMKAAEVSPIYKKADSLNKGNHRPVSVLTTVSKLYESVMNDQMIQHFIHIFDDLLCAYRKGYSSQALLTKCLEDWKAALDHREIVGCIFMDLSKAFDCLPHSLLVAKLHAYGFSYSACELIASYLCERRQRVKINNVRSEWKTLCKGVPQGSILGPLLFNAFINDLFYFVEKCMLYNYADDNSMSHAAPAIQDVCSALEHDGNIAIDWFESNGMQANPSKFQLMIMSPIPTEPVSITLKGNTVIMSESCVKVLGILIDNRLDFSQHISLMCSKAARQLNALARISKYLDQSSLKTIHNSFISSNFSYCPLVWHFCGKVNNEKIEKIQERSLRILQNDFTSSYHDMLRIAEMTPALIYRLRVLTLEVFKSLQKSNPPCLHDLFEINKTEYLMRNPMRLIQPKRRTTTYGIRTVSYIGANIWNQLPFISHDTLHMSASEFKQLLNVWNGPDLNSAICKYV